MWMIAWRICLRKVKQLQNRIILGFGIGTSVGAIVLAGGWFSMLLWLLMCLLGQGIILRFAAGMTPPP
ncbi:hypothetical protein LIER_20337 [Lithospermum erythrorhizon]|uniref:Uncharacterized protein n=1 Tax=Lithospermum erythrorhizon TaxID=34254 RepID=A0AAV3QL33_LITER